MEKQNITVQVVLAISVSKEGVSVNEIERKVFEAAGMAVVKAVKTLQKAYAERLGDGWQVHDWRGRTLHTRFGTLRLPVLRMRNVNTGERLNVFKKVLGCSGDTKATIWLQEQGAKLRVKGLSYRQAAEVVSDVSGVSISGTRLWRWIQDKGRECERAESARSEKVWRGECVSKPARVPSRLYLEADEIYLKSQRRGDGGGRSVRVKVGIAYTGRVREGGGKYKRWRLKDKSVYASVVDGISEFGRRWYSEVEGRYGVSEVKAVLYLCDQDAGLFGVREENFPQSELQVDLWHVGVQVRQSAPDGATSERWLSMLMRGQLKELLAEVREYKRRRGKKLTASEADKLHGLELLLDKRPESVHGARRWRERWKVPPEERVPRGTGGVEKTEEVLIGRTMKRRGMSWTRQGAHNLVKLIIAAQDEKTWNALWQERPPKM